MKTAENSLQVTASSGECFNYTGSGGKTNGKASVFCCLVRSSNK